MRKASLLSAVAGSMMLLTAASALAQVVEITPDEETEVYTTVTRERVRTPPPAGFNVTVGATVPADVELYPVPNTVRYAPYRQYRYTVMQDRVYIIDPGTRRVVRVINRR